MNDNECFCVVTGLAIYVLSLMSLISWAAVVALGG